MNWLNFGNMRKILLSVILCLLCCMIHAAEEVTVKVSGFVTDPNRRALELVNVFEQNTLRGAVTDADGYYEMTLPERDTLVLRYSCLSYQTAVRIVPVEGLRHIQLNLPLQAVSKTLQDVSVTAQRRQENTMQNIDASDIRLLPDPSGGTIEALLVTFAGVSSNNELSTQYSVRGGNYDENLVYVNGTEIYRPLLIRSGQQEGLSFVNPQLTSSVKFSAGGFDAQYGDKSASVLDIEYKRPKRFEGSLDISLLGANLFIGSASKDGRFTQIHGLRYKTNAYLLGTLETEGEYKPSYFDYQTFLTYKLTPKLELSLLGNFSQNTYQFTPESRTTETGTFDTKYTFKVYFDGMERDLFRTAFGALGLKYDVTDNVRLDFKVSAWHSDEHENYDITGQYWLSQAPIRNNEVDTTQANLIGVGTYHEHARNELSATVANVSHTGSWKAGENLVKWGVAYQREIIRDKMREWELLDSAGYNIPYSTTSIDFRQNLISRQELSTNRFTAFIQDTWKKRTTAGLITVTGGVRANYWSFNRQLLISPRASVGFIPAWEHDFTFRLSGGIYYQAPFYKEIRDTVVTNGVSRVVLNDRIKAPMSSQIVLGSDYHFIAWDRPFKLTAEAYYKHTDNLIPYVVDNVRIRYAGENKGFANTGGVDLKLFGEFVPGTDSWITFSWMSSKETIDGYTVPTPNEQRWNFSMFFRDYIPKFPKYSMTLRFVWADGLSFGPPSMDYRYQVHRMKPYRRVDIGASRVLVGGEDIKAKWLRWLDNVWISIDCFNLFGIDNTNSYYWVRDISNQEWAIPNYLTGRRLNLSISMDFK